MANGKRTRDALCDAQPHQHDALLPRERQVLELWDAGWLPATIAAALWLDPKTVKDIVTAFDDREDGREAAALRSGSARLIARIHECFPDMVTGLAA